MLKCEKQHQNVGSFQKIWTSVYWVLPKSLFWCFWCTYFEGLEELVAILLYYLTFPGSLMNARICLNQKHHKMMKRWSQGHLYSLFDSKWEYKTENLYFLLQSRFHHVTRLIFFKTQKLVHYRSNKRWHEQLNNDWLLQKLISILTKSQMCSMYNLIFF